MSVLSRILCSSLRAFPPLRYAGGGLWRFSGSLALLLIVGALGVLSRGADFGEATPATGESRVQFGGKAFGTTYSVIAVLPADSVRADDLQVRVEALLDEIDGQMSLWRGDSELSRFNADRGTDWFEVSAETAQVLAAALDVSRASGGAFDPTVGPLVELWNFGPHKGHFQIPSESELAQARQSVGPSLIEVRLSPPAIRKLRPEVQVDLNGIAKGAAVDRVFALLVNELEPLGVLIEIGGEMRTSGAKEAGAPWRVGIERPIVGERVVHSLIDLNSAALATSGDYRNFVEADGRRFSHTIDPRTGRPVEHALGSVSVIAGDCMTADAWATALMVLGEKEGFSLAEAEGLGALFLTRTNEGVRARATSHFPPTGRISARSAAVGEGGGSVGTFVIAALVFGLAIAGMAIGVLVSNRRLRGSCGGLSGLKDEHGQPLCTVCSHPAGCDEFRQRTGSAAGEPPGEGTKAGS